MSKLINPINKALRIGVSGHRYLSEQQDLQRGIDQALDRIDLTYPHRSLSIISALAEGADRLVVERIWLAKPGAGLIVPLPVIESEYLKDFETSESRDQFLFWMGRAQEIIPAPEVSSRNEGYWAAGKWMLDHCDVLIALWDGQTAQGRGGTAEMVALARQQRLPLAWVRCDNHKPGMQQPASLGEEQGWVSFERF